MRLRHGASRCTPLLLAALLALLWLGRLPAQVAEDPVADLEERIAELRASGEYEEALEAAREVAALTRDDTDSTPSDVADAERLVEALGHVLDLPDSDRRQLAVADSLALAGRRLFDAGRYADGIVSSERGLAIRREILGEDHPEVATATNFLGVLLLKQGDFDRSEEHFLEALEKTRRLHGEEHHQFIIVLNNLAAVRREKGDLVGAEESFSEVLDVFASIFGEEDLRTMSVLLNLASVLKGQGKYAEAEAHYRRALAIRQKVLGREHRDVAKSMRALASILRKQGDYASAEPLYREALAITRRLLGEDHPDVASSLNGLAVFLEDQGDYASAEPLFREALALRGRTLGPEHRLVAESLNNLAAVLKEQDDYAAAEPLYRQALEIRRKALGEEHTLTANTMSNLGSLLMAKGEYDAAEELIREALAIDRRLLGEEHPSIANNLQKLAVLLYERGHHLDPDTASIDADSLFTDAESLFSEALAMRRGLLGEEHPYVAVTLSKYALLLKAGGDYASAEPILEEACSVYDAARLRAGTGISRATFLGCPYADLAQVYLALGSEEDAWPAAERALARALADLIVASASRDLTPEESAEQEELSRNLADRERELGVYRAAAATDTSAEALERFEEARNSLLDAEAAWGGFQRTMAAKYPVTEGQAFSLERVQRALSPDEAIVGWLDVATGTSSHDSWAYVVRSEGPVTWAHVVREEGGSPLDQTARFRVQLADPATAQIALKLTGHRIWSERIEPVEDALAGVERLVVVPSGSMLGVPVESLVDRDGAYVGDRFAVSYVPSATICAWLSERAAESETRGALLVGDPPFTERHRAAMTEAPFDGSDLAEDDRHRQARDVLPALPRLPGTRREILALAEVLPGATILLGPQASEQELTRLVDAGRLVGFRMIHLATHAQVDDTRPGRSSLVLSQVDLPDPLDAAISGDRVYDGLLTATEIVHEWELDADLVTLSACETALGRETGGEGYIGLAHAFLQAGARSLLVSLWKVEDQAASLLMRRFYENRTGSYEGERAGLVATPMSKDAALSEAKRWLRGFVDELGNRPYQRPFYWSAFILLGERS
jgi:CHAT domain-containing protein/Tfp pilus assembly protein PilF